MRYLVVVPPGRSQQEASFHEIDSERELVVGDELLVDELMLRIQAAIDVPADDGYDATLVCAPD
jgi:hypothetical protein